MKLSELKRWVDSQLENGDNEVFISVDVSTSEKDFDHRIYAEPISIINQGAIGYTITADKTEDNYDKDSYRQKV